MKTRRINFEENSEKNSSNDEKYGKNGHNPRMTARKWRKKVKSWTNRLNKKHTVSEWMKKKLEIKISTDEHEHTRLLGVSIQLGIEKIIEKYKLKPCRARFNGCVYYIYEMCECVIVSLCCWFFLLLSAAETFIDFLAKVGNSNSLLPFSRIRNRMCKSSGWRIINCKYFEARFHTQM